MRKILLMAALCMAAVLAFAPVAMAQEDPCPDPDFPRQTPDGCQASDLPDVVPGASASSSASASPSAVEGVPQNCDDFASQAAAQDFFDDDPSDPQGLDADDDGVACEDSEFTGGGTTPSGGQYQYNNGGATTTGAVVTDLPDTGGPNVAAYALPSLALLLATGIFAARIVRR